jgi:hypothetical protein
MHGISHGATPDGRERRSSGDRVLVIELALIELRIVRLMSLVADSPLGSAA